MSSESELAAAGPDHQVEADAPDALISRVVAAIGAGRLDGDKFVLHPYLHWTMATGETLRGRTKVLAALRDPQRRVAEAQAPSRIELRDGQIYRWMRS